MTPLAELRRDLGMSLDAMARIVGLRSRGHLSQIEHGETDASVSVALNLEALTGSVGLASVLCPDVALVRAHDADGLAHRKSLLLAANVNGLASEGAENPGENVSRTEGVAA
jgi:transcriptional regulator with XRE-family HTH domain